MNQKRSIANATDNCPDRETLSDLLSTQTSLDKSVEKHVDHCIACQKVLEELSNLSSLEQYRDAARRLAKNTDEQLLGSNNNRQITNEFEAIDGYKIQSFIARGGMGEVFKGFDPELNRTVAIKVLPLGSNPDAASRFAREAKAMGKIDHPQIVSVYASGRLSDGRPWIAMQYIEGKSLKELIQAEKQIEPREAALIIHQVCNGLAATHNAKLLHRDVKPSNILLDEENGSALLADFGLARHDEDQTLTKVDVVCGTPEYLSPEQCGDTRFFDCRSDIYALGISLYESLIGSPPFQGQPIQIIEQHLQAEPIALRKLNSKIPIELQNICLKAIAKDPQARYQTAIDFAADLNRFLIGKPVLARQSTVWQRSWSWCRRNPQIAGWATAFLFLLMVSTIGSIIFAATLLASNNRLQIEIEKVNQAEARSVQDRTAALTALEKLVDTVASDLANNAATIDTRQQVVQAAIDGFRSLTEAQDDRPADELAFRASLQIADLAALKGDANEAESSYQLAINLMQSKYDQAQDNVAVAAKLAKALVDYSEYLSQRGDQRAEEVAESATTIVDNLLANDPELAEAGNLKLILLAQNLERLRRKNPQDPAAVIRRGDSMLQELQTPFEQHAADSDAMHAWYRIHFLLGRSRLEAGDATGSRQNFEQTRACLNSVLSKTPNNVRLQVESAVLDRALGMALGASGELELAISSLERACKLQQRLSATDLNDVTQVIDLANTRTILADAYQFAGDFAKGIRTLELAVDSYKQHVSNHPGDQSQRLLLINGLLKLAELNMLDHRWDAAKDAITVAELTIEKSEVSDELKSMISLQETKLKLSVETISLLNGNGQGSETATSRMMAMLWLARKDADYSASLKLSKATLETLTELAPDFHGETFDDLLDHLGGMHDLLPTYAPLVLFFRARIFGLISRNINQAANSENSAGIETAQQKCFEALFQIVESYPSAAKDIIANNPDLRFIRRTKRYLKFSQDNFAR